MGDHAADNRALGESYLTLFETNPQPMWVHHRESGRVLEANPAMVARFGWSRAELLGLHIDDLFACGTSAEVFDDLVATASVDRSGPWDLTTRANEIVHCEITASEVLELQGQPSRLVVVLDITERERARRQHEEAQRMESLGQLAGGIAHDFNNVLSVMNNYTAFAATEVALAARVEPVRWDPVLDDLEQVRAAGARASVLVQQLLSFASGRSAQVGLVDLNEVTVGLGQMLQHTLGARVDLELSLAAGAWPATANAGQLEQVIVNLAVNARDAMPDGGTVSIETENVEVGGDPPDAAPDAGLAAGRYVRLRVRDTGKGMDAEVLGRACEPFFTTKAHGRGTGLGLATVYGVVTSAGGTLQIDSEPGHGTCISALFPVPAV